MLRTLAVLALALTLLVVWTTAAPAQCGGPACRPVVWVQPAYPAYQPAYPAYWTPPPPAPVFLTPSSFPPVGLSGPTPPVPWHLPPPPARVLWVP